MAARGTEPVTKREASTLSIDLRRVQEAMVEFGQPTMLKTIALKDHVITFTVEPVEARRG